MKNENLFAALRAAFPADLDAIAIETDNGLNYSWRDLDRATAMLANLLESLQLPAGSRIAVQVDKSVEALALYLATLRAGFVFLPLNTAYQSAEMAMYSPWTMTAPDHCLRGLQRRDRAATNTPWPHARRVTWQPFCTPAAPPGAAKAPCCRTATC